MTITFQSMKQRRQLWNDDLYWEREGKRHLMSEAYDLNRDAIFGGSLSNARSWAKVTDRKLKASKRR